MAPGPRVNVYESLADLKANICHVHENDEDDEGSKMRYYKSSKILGQLYRSIDEVSFLRELEKTIEPDPNTPNVLLTLWDYIKHDTALFVWDHQVGFATDIKET